MYKKRKNKIEVMSQIIDRNIAVGHIKYVTIAFVSLNKNQQSDFELGTRKKEYNLAKKLKIFSYSIL